MNFLWFFVDVALVCIVPSRLTFMAPPTGCGFGCTQREPNRHDPVLATTIDFCRLSDQHREQDCVRSLRIWTFHIRYKVNIPYFGQWREKPAQKSYKGGLFHMNTDYEEVVWSRLKLNYKGREKGDILCLCPPWINFMNLSWIWYIYCAQISVTADRPGLLPNHLHTSVSVLLGTPYLLSHLW